MLSKLFQPQHGLGLVGAIVGSLVFTLALVIGLMMIPVRFRKYFIWTATFVGGLFYSLEYLWSTHKTPTPANPTAVGNFLTPYIVPVGTILGVISVFTLGLGVINLVQLHGKRIFKGSTGYVNSIAFFVAFMLMLVVQILQKYFPYKINQKLFAILYEGAYQNMDATMFSIIAFYIVSAAYRAFRARNLEASLLLVTAVIVMIGQTALGQMMTSWLPDIGFESNFRVEVIRDWIMTKANVPVTRAIQFGLGIGALAVALRIWLGLERGSYFENKG